MRKKYGILIAILLVSFILIFVLIVRLSNKNVNEKEEREKKTELVKEKQSTSRTIETEGFEMLESYIASEKVVMISDAVCEFISADMRLDRVEVIICEDAFETENKINFYGTYDATDQIVFFAEYDKNSGDLFQYTEEMTHEEAKEKWIQKKEEVIETKDWEEEKELPEAWTYIEEDSRELTIENMDTVSDIITRDEQQNLQEELLLFLKENSEFRRELFICDFSKEDVVIGFKNERIDGKIVKARIDAQTRTWTFELVEGGERNELH